MPTLEDVAKKAGVSTATVSRVINGNVRTTTRNHELVRKAVEEIGYNSSKRVLDRKTILVINMVLGNHMVQALENSAGKYNCTTAYKFVMSSDINPDDIPFHDDLDGIIICNSLASEENYRRLRSICPIVLCRVLFDYPNTISVSIDDEQASYDLTTYLIEKGRRNIAMLCDITQSYSGEETVNYKLLDRGKQLRGYIRALEEHGLPVDKDLIMTTDFDDFFTDMSEFIGYVIKIGKCPDAVVSTIPAIAEIRAEFRKHDKKVPDDVAVATFAGGSLPMDDDIVYIEIPESQIADITMHSMLSAINGDLPPNNKISVNIAHVLHRNLD